jgi:hypothetical protein
MNGFGLIKDGSLKNKNYLFDFIDIIFNFFNK